LEALTIHGVARRLCLFLGLLLPALIAAISVPSASAAPAVEIWIAPRTDGLSGKGTPSDPFDGSTSAKFDALMSNVPAGAAIHLMEGTFLTHGIVPKSEWKLYLTNQTTLRLDILASIPGQKWAIIPGAAKPVSNILIEGGVWDCNLQNQKIPLAAQAISFVTDRGNVTIRNLKVINWGSTFPKAECFAVSVFNVGSTASIARNIVFDGIEVTQPAPLVHRGTSTLIGAHGQGPVSPNALSNGWLQGVEIKNCYVHDIDLPLMTAAIGMGSWCQGVHIHHNRFERLGPRSDTLFGCYIDTGASEDLLIEENDFRGVSHGVFANLDAANPVQKWVVRKNLISINRNGSSGGIELRSRTASIHNVLIEENTVESLTGASLVANGILLRGVNGATIRDNVVNNVNASTDIILELGVTDCRVSNNRNRAGGLIEPKNRKPF
jgi:hypothetical protein